MFIVLEGCDGAGKTTLAERLADRARQRDLKADVWHRGVPVRHPLEEYELDLETDYPRDVDERLSTLIVADRWHLGQLVYGGLYRDANDLGEGGALHVDLLLESIGATQFIVSPPLDIIRDRLRVRGEDYLKEEHVERVWNHYEQLAKTRRLTSKVNRVEIPDDVLDSTIDFAAHMTEMTNPLVQFESYIGPRNPRLLIVVDEVREPERMHSKAAQHRATMVPYPGTTGRWLMNMFSGSATAGRGIGIVNGRVDDVRSLYLTLSGPRVVALGEHASDELEALSVPHGAVPTPPHSGDESQMRAYATMIAVSAETRRKKTSWPS